MILTGEKIDNRKADGRLRPELVEAAEAGASGVGRWGIL